MSVYLIANLEAQVVKIGRSADPQARLRCAQTYNHQPLSLLGIISSPLPDSVVEKQMHEIFSARRIQGEWFNIPANIDWVHEYILDHGFHTESASRTEDQEVSSVLDAKSPLL
jgi:hypothetical protein